VKNDEINTCSLGDTCIQPITTAVNMLCRAKARNMFIPKIRPRLSSLRYFAISALGENKYLGSVQKWANKTLPGNSD
jgi:hypothetical protein